MDRLKLLKQFAQEEPGDPFNLYALALEYLKINPSEADRLFEKLVSTHPDYLPTYYPYAHLLIERKDLDKAERIFQQGMETAKAKNEFKTFREIQAAYDDWKNEMSNE